ncbi:MFS transporter [Candidatus Halocynthiibacter alkanivorans]|jgi:MFS family permease|uniref:MFS transporter n=1 Tax=Candidatus Halocynthiibacter alkanivorans TaxID=2267619 RepID=UPI000DF15A7B|nr:MFS transporter [Candidatus Halocynthiibacter alkanivorans]
MTDMTALPDSNFRSRRNVMVLMLAQALLGAQMPMIFIVGGLAGQSLASNINWATLPISFIILGSVLAANPLSWVMQHQGRKTGFLIGAMSGATGAAISAYALIQKDFQLFLLGSLFTGVYMSAQGFYRFAATDTASAEFRPKAISYVMSGGLVAAIIGPQLVKATLQPMDVAVLGASQVDYLGIYLAVIAINVVGSFVFFFLDIPTPEAPAKDAARGRSRLELLRNPRVLVAIICAMVSYSLMTLVMTSTPLAVVGAGHGEMHAADIVSFHVLAMFIPSFFTGHLIARFGTERIITLGLVTLLTAGLIGLSGVSLMHFKGALVLLGLGWNFGFIGATTMLAGTHSPEERGRVQGMNDMMVFGFVTLASLASGALMNGMGSSAQDGWTAVNLAMAPFLALAGGALIWLVMQPKSEE